MMNYKECNFYKSMDHMLGGREAYCLLKNANIGMQSCDREDCIFMKLLKELK